MCYITKAISEKKKGGKKMQYLFYIIGLIISVILLFVDTSFSIGIMLALFALTLLNLMRNRFYLKVFNLEKLNLGLIVGYSLVVMAIMFFPLGLAFLFPERINPYFMAGTIILERLYKFVTNIFWPNKEELNV